jgi:hypothetical protein
MSQKVKVGIVGGTGYTGSELLRILARHPQAKIQAITSRGEAGTSVAKLFPSLRSVLDDLVFTTPDEARLTECDVVFFATPHGVAAAQAKELTEAGVKVIDLAADFRLQDLAVWEKWYAHVHPSPELVPSSVYGLPEVNREAIKSAMIIGNPGCYPTATQLALMPLLEHNLRYGIQSTLGGLPEGVLLVEPMKIAEVQADTQSWIAAIKGTSYDTPVAPTRTLIGLDSRVGAVEGASQMLQGAVSNLSSATVALDNRATALENKVGSNVIKEFGLAPEFANMVFDNSNLVNTDGIWLGGADMGPTSIHTFLEWSTNVVSTPQSNRVRVMVKLPHDFGLWHPLMPIRIWYKGDGDASKIGLNVTVFDEFATVTNISSEPMLFGANIGVWNQHVTSAIENGVFAPNQWICLTFETTAEGVGNTVKIGRIDCKYLTA